MTAKKFLTSRHGCYMIIVVKNRPVSAARYGNTENQD